MRRHLSGIVLACATCLLAIAAATPAPAAESVGYRVVGSIKGADGPWDYAIVDHDTHRLYVARGDGVMAVNLDDEAVTPTLVAGGRVHGIVALPGGLAISTNGDTSSATLFTLSDGLVVAQFPMGKKPDAVVRDPNSGLVAVMNSLDGTVSLIDIEKKQQVGSIAVGGTLEFAVADGEGRVFVNVEDKNEVVELDLPGRKVVAHRALPRCDGPTGLALDRDSHVLLAACGNGKAVALSAQDGQVLATLPIGSHPDAVLFDDKTKRFLVPCGGDGTLTVIGAPAGGKLAVIASVVTAKGARTGAVDSASGKVYLPTADMQPPKAAGGRATPVPGSFRILVLGQS